MARTLIEQQLSPAQVEDFYQRCKVTKGGLTGPVITAIAADFGVDLQHDAANNVRKMFLARHKAELQDHAEISKALALSVQDTLGLNDAAAFKLSLKVNDDLDKSEDLSIDEKNKYSLLISRLRAGDQRGRMVEVLQEKLRLQQFDAATAAIKHAKEIRAVLSDKKLDDTGRTERIRTILFGAQPADFVPVEAKGAQPEEPAT